MAHLSFLALAAAAGVSVLRHHRPTATGDRPPSRPLLPAQLPCPCDGDSEAAVRRYAVGLRARARGPSPSLPKCQAQLWWMMASKCTATAPSLWWASQRGLVGSWVLVHRAKCGALGGRVVVCAAVSFRPCIDIHKGKVKQIVGSTLRDSSNDGMELVTNFESDKSPAEFTKLYKEDELLGGHVIMLGADPASQAAALEALHAYPGGLQVGGGINLENAMSYLNEGASHVIVTSYVFSDAKMNIERLRKLVELVGKQRLVLDLSCRKKDGRYTIVTERWQKFNDVFVDKPTLEYLAAFADEFLVHGVDVEGKRLGIDEELVELLGHHSPIPVTYAGGVSTMGDLERIKKAGKSRVDVTVGSALDIFGGDLPYKDVVLWHKKQSMVDQV